MTSRRNQEMTTKPKGTVIVNALEKDRERRFEQALKDLSTPPELACAALQAVHRLNRTTRGSGKKGWSCPSYPRATTSALKLLAQYLPQTFEQIAEGLTELEHTGRVYADDGNAAEHLGDARSALSSAAALATALNEVLERAHSDLLVLGYRD